MRHHPDFQLLDPRGVWRNDNGLILRLLTDNRLLSAAARWVFTLHTDAFHAIGRRLKVDSAFIGFVDELRPGRIRFGACPMAKSNPEPEYSTLFNEPIAFDALSMTVLASCATTADAKINTTA